MLRAIMRLMLMSILGLAISACAVGQDVNANSPLMNKAQFEAFLEKVGYAAAQWRVKLKAIDIESLHVDYEDGKRYERVIGLCLDSLNEIESAKGLLSKGNTLSVEILLLQNLTAFRAQMMILEDMLRRFDTPTNGRTRELHEIVLDQASPIIDQLYHHSWMLAGLVDKVIDVSDPYAPRLRSKAEATQLLGLNPDSSKTGTPNPKDQK